MKKIIIVFIAMAVISLSYSCKARKTVIETHTTDTIYKSEIIKVTPAQLNSLVIDSPCDSLGNLKPFTYSFGTGNNKMSLKAKNNTIYLTQNLDSIKSVWEKEYKAKTNVSIKETVKEVTPTYIWKFIVALLITIFFETLIILKWMKP